MVSAHAEPAVIAPTELLGRWRLERRVIDRGAGASGRVLGTLELQAVGDDVSWDEHGIFSWAGHELPVTRRLRIRPGPTGWMVHFDDGREFHPWRPGATVEHPCRADLYRGRIEVDPSCTRLRVLWDVTGPAKAQRLFTRCRRETGDGNNGGAGSIGP